MIITRDYAKRLIAKGNAYYVAGSARDSLTTANKEGICYAVVNRIDIQRVDHFAVLPVDIHA
jgi:hypothetical protein